MDHCVNTEMILDFSILCHFKLLSDEVTSATSGMSLSMESAQSVTCITQASVSTIWFQVENDEYRVPWSVVTRMFPELLVSAFLESKSMHGSSK